MADKAVDYKTMSTEDLAKALARDPKDSAANAAWQAKGLSSQQLRDFREFGIVPGYSSIVVAPATP